MNNIGDYKYDAFISYRHLELDSHVAKKLQNLLEGYKAPKHAKCQYTSKIKRLFRDETELNSNGNLSNEIKGALENSRFLVVVCSEETKNSKWCMEEIEYFKSLHGWHLDNILTLLVSGNPNEVFPHQLCYETKETFDDSGNPQTVQYEVEPLAANVTAKNKGQAIRKLKKEYLRIAAAILGCEFDTLYKRHKRIRIKNALCLASVISVICIILGTVFLNQFAASEERQSRLLHSSAVSFMNDTDSADYQKSMYYLAKSAANHYPKEKFQNVTIHKALRSAYFPVESECLNGKITGNAIVAEQPSQNGYSEVLVSKSMKFVTAANPKNGRMLIYNGENSYITDKDKKISNETFITSCSNGRYWVFSPDREPAVNEECQVTVYDSDSEKFHTLDFVAKNNPLIKVNTDDTFGISVDICESYAVITCRGYLYLYTFDGNNYTITNTISYVEFLSTKDTNGTYPIASENPVIISGKLKMVAINDLNETIIISAEAMKPINVIPTKGILMSDWVFSENGYQLLISYGTVHDTSEGRIELYEYDTSSSKYILLHERKLQNAVAEVCFTENDEVIIARDFTNGVYITTKSSRLIYHDHPPIFMSQKIKAITGGGDFAFAVSTNDDTLHFMDVVSQKEERYLVNPGDSGIKILEIHPQDDGKLAVLSRKALKIMDTNGNIDKVHYFDSKEYFDYLEANRHKFQENFTTYDTKFGKWDKYIFPGSENLKKDISHKFIKYCTENNIAVNQDVSSLSNMMRLSSDGERVYVANSVFPCLCSFKINDENTAELEHAIMFSSEIPKDLFDSLNEKQLAVSTTSGKIMIYTLPLSDNAPKTVKTLTSGEIREVRIDESGKFMAVSIKKSKHDAMELWDLENMSLIDVKSDEKKSASGICFYDNKFYYGFGEHVNCININGKEHSTADYKALLKLSGVISTKKDSFEYSIPKRADIEDMLDTWDLEITSHLNPNASDTITINDMFKSLATEIAEKTSEEKLKILKENKKAFCDLYTITNGIQPISEYYRSLISLTKSIEGEDAAKALTREYCDIISASVLKPIYEWNITDHNSVKTQLYSSMLNVYAQIPEEVGTFKETLTTISEYIARSVISADDIYDYYNVLSVTKNSLITIATEGEYLSYVIGGEVDALEKELADNGLLTINNDDNPDVQISKKTWMLRMALLGGDVTSAVALEREIMEASAEYYVLLMSNDWEYFKMFGKTGIIPESVISEYYSAMVGINGMRDNSLK